LRPTQAVIHYNSHLFVVVSGLRAGQSGKTPDNINTTSAQQHKFYFSFALFVLKMRVFSF